MEKLIKRNRKNYRIIQQNAQNLDPATHSFRSEEEHSAKNMLFQLAEIDPPHEEKTLRLNEWLKTEDRPTPQREYYTPVRTTSKLRRTVHMRPFGEHKPTNQSYQCFENIEESIIPHLKLQLLKLESPEKRREAQEKKRKVEYLEKKIQRKNEGLLVEHLLESKKPSLRTKKTQSEKKPKPHFMFFNNFPQGKKGSLGDKCPAEQTELLKQARRNRTLKNLLL